MNSVEVLSSERYAERTTFEAACRERRERVLNVLREIPEIFTEFRRTSITDIAAYITAQHVDISESVAAHTLEEISETGDRLDDNGTTIQTGIYRGCTYVTAVRPEEPVRSLPCPNGETELVQAPRSVISRV